jgi:hypothetical protein
MSKRKKWSLKRLRELQQWADANGAESFEQGVCWADPEGKLPDIMQSFTDYSMMLSERQVAILKSAQDSGRHGSKRNLKTVKALRERNAKIRQEYTRYKLQRVRGPLAKIAKHFMLSPKQVGRIVEDLK